MSNGQLTGWDGDTDFTHHDERNLCRYLAQSVDSVSIAQSYTDDP
jgi:hypothetical protein